MRCTIQIFVRGAQDLFELFENERLLIEIEGIMAFMRGSNSSNRRRSSTHGKRSHQAHIELVYFGRSAACARARCSADAGVSVGVCNMYTPYTRYMYTPRTLYAVIALCVPSGTCLTRGPVSSE